MPKIIDKKTLLDLANNDKSRKLSEALSENETSSSITNTPIASDRHPIVTTICLYAVLGGSAGFVSRGIICMAGQNDWLFLKYTHFLTWGKLSSTINTNTFLVMALALSCTVFATYLGFTRIADISTEGMHGMLIFALVCLGVFAGSLMVNALIILERFLYMPVIPPIAAWSIMGTALGSTMGGIRIFALRRNETLRNLVLAGIVVGVLAIAGFNWTRTATYMEIGTTKGR